MLAKMKIFSLVNSQKIFSNWKMLKFCTLFWHIFRNKDLEKIRSFSIRSLIFWIYDPITILWEKRIYDPIQSSKKKDLDPKGSRSNPILQYSVYILFGSIHCQALEFWKAVTGWKVLKYRLSLSRVDADHVCCQTM